MGGAALSRGLPLLQRTPSLIALGTHRIQKHLLYTFPGLASAVLTPTATVPVDVDFTGFVETNRLDDCIILPSSETAFFHGNGYIQKYLNQGTYIWYTLILW